ncbi:MAG: ABC transporter permease, partial [Peptostreptococcaceae bacterium]
MIKNTNSQIIEKLSKRSFKDNKSRNKIAIISIVLTTLLFTSLFTIGMGILKSNEYSRMRMVGGSSHGNFKNLTVKEYNNLKDNSLIKSKGISVPIAIGENEEFAKRQVEIRYGDKKYIELAFATPMKGSIPIEKNEILVDTITLDLLGLPYELNQNIKLTYKIDNKEYTDEFKISGIFEGEKVAMASSLYVSQSFIKDILANVDQEKSKAENDFVGLISLDVKFSNSNNIEKKLAKVIIDSGYDINEIEFGVNWAYMGGNSLDIGTVLGTIGLILIIMLTGYLIIYNIFYISIVREIKFYGQLKTIGTTKKQIKKIIIKQALKLSLIGIPVGLILGYIIGVMTMPLIMRTVNISHIKLSITPIIFIGATIFSLSTVLISVYKPAKIASKVSPVEAIRYTGVSENTKRKIKKTSNGAKINNMALANIFRNKKKAIIVISSLSLSIILLNTVYTMVSGMDMGKFLSKSIGTDFTIGDTSFYRWKFDPSAKNSLTEEIVKELQNLDGVKSVDKMYYTET